MMPSSIGLPFGDSSRAEEVGAQLCNIMISAFKLGAELQQLPLDCSAKDTQAKIRIVATDFYIVCLSLTTSNQTCTNKIYTNSASASYQS
jgi:hypothetical protein